jgi:hypothetical protein
LINFLVNSPTGTFFLESVNVSHSNLRNNAVCVLYVRQRRTTHIMTKCIEINVTNIIMLLLHSGSLTKIEDKYKAN